MVEYMGVANIDNTKLLRLEPGDIVELFSVDGGKIGKYYITYNGELYVYPKSALSVTIPDFKKFTLFRFKGNDYYISPNSYSWLILIGIERVEENV